VVLLLLVPLPPLLLPPLLLPPLLLPPLLLPPLLLPPLLLPPLLLLLLLLLHNCCSEETRLHWFHASSMELDTEFELIGILIGVTQGLALAHGQGFEGVRGLGFSCRQLCTFFELIGILIGVRNRVEGAQGPSLWARNVVSPFSKTSSPKTLSTPISSHYFFDVARLPPAFHPITHTAAPPQA
jgi:hypothetical protein